MEEMKRFIRGDVWVYLFRASPEDDMR